MQQPINESFPAKTDMRWQLPVIALVWLLGLYACVRSTGLTAVVQLYISISIFIVILRNLGQRRDGLSAYSVFNADCTPLLGQLQPEQFENEMRHRPLYVYFNVIL